MGSELSFIDTANSCEVHLKGYQRELYERYAPEFERLKDIRSLGVMALKKDISKHTRHDHLIGMYRIYDKLSRVEVGDGLPNQLLGSFWVNLCFRQTGHAALSYDAESAVMIACKLDSQFAIRVEQMLKPVFDSISVCNVCKKPFCEAKKADSSTAQSWFKELLDSGDGSRIHRWIAALKYLRSTKSKPAFTVDKNTGLKPAPRDETIKMLVAPNCAFDKAIANLNRLDYIPRDLAFAGTVKTSFDVDRLVQLPDREHRDWQLLRNLVSYMSTFVYHTPESLSVSVPLQTYLAHMLLNDELTLEELFGLNGQTLTDDELLAKVASRKAGRLVHDAIHTRNLATWRVSVGSDTLEIEPRSGVVISSLQKRALKQFSKDRIISFRCHDGSRYVTNWYEDKSNRPHALAVLKAFKAIDPIKGSPQAAFSVARSVFEALFGERVTAKTRDAVKHLTKLDIPPELLQKAMKQVYTIHTKSEANGVNAEIKFGNSIYALPTSQRSHLLLLAHHHYSASREDRNAVRFTSQQAAELLWTEVLLFPSKYQIPRIHSSFASLIRCAKTMLRDRALANASSSSKDMEVLSLLLAHEQAASSGRYVFVSMGLSLIGSNDQPQNEIDAAALFVPQRPRRKSSGKRNHQNHYVGVQLWEATIAGKNQLAEKKKTDRSKMEAIRQKLTARWDSEISVEMNSLYIQNQRLYIDNGSQQRELIF